MALVIKSWKVNENPVNGEYVRIVGRQPGLISWFLALMGIDAVTTFIVTEDKIQYEEGSWQGQTKVIVPLNVITRSYYGYVKPWKEALALGLVLSPVFGLGLIVGPLYYFLNKSMNVGFVEMSAWSAGISFKRSVIEGENIDENAAHKILILVQGLVDKQSRR